MKTADQCRIKADALEALAMTETEDFRRKAYRQMSAFWRESEKVRSGTVSEPSSDATRSSPRKT